MDPKRRRPANQPKASYTYEFIDGVLVIIDLDEEGSRSVTNDIFHVLCEIEEETDSSVAGQAITYRDSAGTWDGVEWDGEGYSFYNICTRLQSEAIDEAKAHAYDR